MGMTLRDYFAAQALPQVVALTANGTFNAPSGNATQADIAKAAYAIADAMIAERGQQSQTPQRSDADY